MGIPVAAEAKEQLTAELREEFVQDLNMTSNKLLKPWTNITDSLKDELAELAEDKKATESKSKL